MLISQRFLSRLSYLLRLSVCMLLLPVSWSKAQGNDDVWETANKAQRSVSQKAGKSIGAVKKWKNHLQQWGLDSNYHHAVFLGGKLYSNGWGGEVFYQKPVGDAYDRRRGKHPGQYQFYRLGFSEVKHEKEVKEQGVNKSFPELGNTTPFIFGKVHNLYLLQIGYGREQILLPGVLQGNISLSFRYSGGLSLAMLKPYFVRLLYVDYTTAPETASLQEERYSDGNREVFLNRDRIFGASKWGKGLGDMDYVPGVFLDGAFAIEPAKGKSFVQLITIGGQFSAYAKSLRIMADQKACPLMGAFYVGLAVGKRW